MKRSSKHAWGLLFLVGLLMAYFAYDNLVVIPGLDPAGLLLPFREFFPRTVEK